LASLVLWRITYVKRSSDDIYRRYNFREGRRIYIIAKAKGINYVVVLRRCASENPLGSCERHCCPQPGGQGSVGKGRQIELVQESGELAHGKRAADGRRPQLNHETALSAGKRENEIRALNQALC
jgi:hypothetical protein